MITPGQMTLTSQQGQRPLASGLPSCLVRQGDRAIVLRAGSLWVVRPRLLGGGQHRALVSHCGAHNRLNTCVLKGESLPGLAALDHRPLQP